MNLRIITKNHAADSKKGPPLKSFLEPIGLTSPSLQPGSSQKPVQKFKIRILSTKLPIG